MDSLTENNAKKYLFTGMVCLGSVGIFGIIVFCVDICHPDPVKSFGESLLVAVASCGGGLLLGMLFGIPKSQDTPQNTSPDTTQVNKNNSYIHNSDLQQISDWLTKIIVGVSLVEAHKIILKIGILLDQLSCLFTVSDKTPSSFYRAYCLVILVFFAVYGFIVGYLCATIYLPVLFKYADKSADDAIEKQSKEDHTARDLTEFQLTLGPGYGNISKSDLLKAITDASPDLKSEIFFKARAFRKKCESLPRNTDSEKNIFKNEIKKAVPVFQALIDDDKGKCFAFTYIQLAYINYATGDYQGAIDNFNTASDIRKKPGNKDVENYPPDYRIPELVRTLCNIQIFNDPQRNKAVYTDDALKTAIFSDLNTIQKDCGLDKVIDKNNYSADFNLINKWFTDNVTNNDNANGKDLDKIIKSIK